MSAVLVTGATGFVGSTFCECLARSGRVVRAAVRERRTVPKYIAETAVVGDIGAGTSWDSVLHGIDSVVHLAARAHVMHANPADADAYFEVNERGTRRLAEAAARAGVARFVFLSTVKVNGEATADAPFTGDDLPNPQDAYGCSKHLAEEHLGRIASASGMEVVIVRAPLVYGPGVRANFLRLLRWIDRQLPLPFGCVRNRRSLASIWNVSDLLMRVLDHAQAPSRIWMVSDGEDLSTPSLIVRIAAVMRRKAWLLPVPMSVLRAGGKLTGQSDQIERLCGSLTVDVTPARLQLGWSAPVDVDEGLARTVAWYLART